MTGSPPTPLATVARGALAGAVGNLAMDLVWYARHRREGGKKGFLAWELTPDADWDDVSAPGQIGKRLVEAFLQHELDAKWAPLVNNAMHWGYGMFWGVQYGIVAASLPSRSARLAVIFGPTVWITSYVVLPLAKVYKPIWDYDARTLGRDLLAHMAYGLGTAGTFNFLYRRNA